MIRIAILIFAFLFTIPPVDTFAGCRKCGNKFPRTQPRAVKKLIKSKVVSRKTKTLTAKDICGRIYTYNVSEITYRNIYSDGTSRIWKSTI